jgi:hypothetical protein
MSLHVCGMPLPSFFSPFHLRHAQDYWCTGLKMLMPGPFVGFLSPCLAAAYVFVSTRVVPQCESWEFYLCLFHVALFQDLGHNLRRVLCAKLILKEAVGGAVKCTLSSVSRRDVTDDGLGGGRE